MSDTSARIRRAVLFALMATAGVAQTQTVQAEPAVRILDLPFKVRDMRGPRSEIALAVSTSGLLPLVRGREASSLAVVWGDEGGAILTVENGTVTAKPIGREAVEDLAASETPRGALPGLRRALEGPLSAFLSGRTRSPDGAPAAANLTIRERQPVSVSTDPKPVPVVTATLPAGVGAVFAAHPPRIVPLAGRPAILAVTATDAQSGSLVLATRPAGNAAAWTISARSVSVSRPIVAGVGSFSGRGPEAATVDSTGRLKLWSLGPDTIEPGPDASGYTLGEGEGDLADTVTRDGGIDLALPVAGMPALAIVSAREGLRERARVTLPAPAGTGVAVLGEGPNQRLLVGLSDGRVAAIALEGGTP